MCNVYYNKGKWNKSINLAKYSELKTNRVIDIIVYVISVLQNKITKPYAKKYDRLLVNDDKIVN